MTGPRIPFCGLPLETFLQASPARRCLMLRTERHDAASRSLPRPPPDLTALDAIETRRRIRELAAHGYPEQTIAELTGLDLVDVRRALSP